MTLLRLIAAVLAGWLLWSWLSRRLGGGVKGSGAGSGHGSGEDRYRGLTDQPIEDAEYEDLSRK